MTSDVELAEIVEAALLTERTLTTDILSQLDQQGMVFIE